MKIKFLKTLGSYRKGKVREVPDVQAKFFIKVGIAMIEEEVITKDLSAKPAAKVHVKEPVVEDQSEEEIKEDKIETEEYDSKVEEKSSDEENTAKRRGRPAKNTYETKVLVADIDK